jgi:MGT family glycosyltransferase
VWVQQLAGGRPLVYATLGTVFNRTPGVMDTLLGGLAEAPWSVLATVGPNRHPSELGTHPGHVRVEPFVPHAEILPFCDAVVSHCGFGTTLDALHAGVPHVAVPFTADQPVHAEAIERLGLGRLIDPRVVELNARGLPRVVPERLAPVMATEAVASVLASAADHRSAIRTVQDEIVALPGPSRFVALLEQLATQRRPLARDPAS